MQEFDSKILIGIIFLSEHTFLFLCIETKISSHKIQTNRIIGKDLCYFSIGLDADD